MLREKQAVNLASVLRVSAGPCYSNSPRLGAQKRSIEPEPMGSGARDFTPAQNHERTGYP